MTVDELLHTMKVAEPGTYLLVEGTPGMKYNYQLSIFKNGESWVYIDEGLHSYLIDERSWAEVIINDKTRFAFS